MADELTPKRTLDRAALDRVLARAAELQSSAIEGGDSGGGLTEAEILELGKEAGMSPQHLQQAIAEERTRTSVTASDDRGLAASVVGPATVRASRIVPGTPRELLDVIDMWMQKQEALKVKRRVTDRIVWEPRRDMMAGIQRSFGGGEFALRRAAEVSATATPIDAGRTLIALDAGLAAYRGSLGAVAGSMAGLGTGASVVGLVLGIMAPVAIIPAVVAVPLSLVIARSAQAKAVDRGQLALEQLLDHLERGDHRKPGGLLAAVTEAAASTFGIKVLRL